MGEIIHYIIVIPLILLIIYYQIRVFVQAIHKIETFKSIFPSNKHAYSISKVNIITNDDELQPHKEEDNAGEIWRDDEDEDEPVSVNEATPEAVPDPAVSLPAEEVNPLIQTPPVQNPAIQDPTLQNPSVQDPSIPNPAQESPENSATVVDVDI